MTPNEDRLWEELAHLFPQSVYIYGGYVRDTILNRPSRDIDFYVNAPYQTVYDTLSATHLVIPMGINHNVMRVNGIEVSADILPIEQKLSTLDYTINSVAFDCNRTLIDPNDHAIDINRRLLSMLTPYSIVSDPIRALRGLRLFHSLQLNSMDKATEDVLYFYVGMILADPTVIQNTWRLWNEMKKILSSEYAQIIWEDLHTRKLTTWSKPIIGEYWQQIASWFVGVDKLDNLLIDFSALKHEREAIYANLGKTILLA